MRKTARIWLLLMIFTLITPGSAYAARIIIDPGHGGADPGAIGVNGLKEKLVNLDISLKVRELLQNDDIEVVMTRETDRYISLSDRIRFSNEQDADLLVSIHANWYTNSGVRGALMLYYDSKYPQASYPASPEMVFYSPISKLFAEKVLDTYTSVTGIHNRGIVPSSVYMVRKGTVPSILIETAFLSNWEDAELLADEEQRSLLAEGIAEGIRAYLNIKFPDAINHWARESILRMADKGWIQGYRNYFEPERALTRGEFVTLMDRVFQFDSMPSAIDKEGPAEETAKMAETAETAETVETAETAEGERSLSFGDLREDHWAYAYMVKGAKLGILQGYPDGTIRPDAPITRGEAAHLFHKIMKASSASEDENQANRAANLFTDVPPDLWSAPAIYAMQRLGLINGSTPTEFKPDDRMKRAEMAIILDRFTKLQ